MYLRATEEQRAIWEQEIEDMVEEMRQEATIAVGDAHLVVFEEEEIQKFHIEPFGRRELTKEGYVVSTGPIDQESKLTYTRKEYMDWTIAEDIINQNPIRNIDRLVSPPEWPERIVPSSEVKYRFEYESTLLSYLVEKVPGLCLLNPSYTTLKAARQALSVCVTDYEYRLEVDGQMQELWGVRIGKCLVKEGDGVSYTPVQPSPSNMFKDWITVIPDPFIRTNGTVLYVTERNDERKMHLSYVRGSRQMHYKWDDEEPLYVYPPNDVRQLLNISGYFIVSTVPLGIPNQVSHTMPHAPRYLSSLGQYKQEGNYIVCRNVQGKIQDVKDEGTYLSRRARLQHLGEWEELARVGIYPITRYTSELDEKHHETHVYRETLVFEDEKGEKTEKEETMILHVYSEGQYYLNPCTDDSYLVPSSETVRTDSVLFRPAENGKYVIDGMPKGILVRPRTKWEKEEVHVYFPFMSGVWLLFPSLDDLNRYGALTFVGIDEWSNFIEYSDLKMNYQSRNISRTIYSASLKKLFDQQKITSWEERGFTPQYLRMRTYISDSALPHTLRAMDILQRDDLSWISMEKCSMRFPGVSLGDSNLADGRTVIEIYQLIMSQDSVRLKSSDFQMMRDFLRLLNQKGKVYTWRKEGDFFCWLVKGLSIRIERCKKSRKNTLIPTYASAPPSRLIEQIENQMNKENENENPEEDKEEEEWEFAGD